MEEKNAVSPALSSDEINVHVSFTLTLPVQTLENTGERRCVRKPDWSDFDAVCKCLKIRGWLKKKKKKKSHKYEDLWMEDPPERKIIS